MCRVSAFLVAAAFALPCLPALADEAPKPQEMPQHHSRMSLEQHFAAANLAHDGHLTLDEAKGGYPLVAKHFHDIDVDGKGYITENDLRAWHALRKATHTVTPQPDEGLQPRHVLQRVQIDQPSASTQLSVSTRMVSGIQGTPAAVDPKE